MRAFEVEGVEVVGKDTVLDIKVLFNRAFDCLSHIGMAREIAAIADVKCNVSSVRHKENKKLKINDFLAVEVKDKKLCPRYSARVIVDIKVGESPKWMRDRLIVCGLRPINNVVDITNYVMLETGQPLHAFDFGKIEGANPKIEARNPKQPPNLKFQIRKIIVRRAGKGEKIITFDGAEYELDENILIIADERGPLAIAGIKGGKAAEINSEIKTIILEAANFDSAATRKNSKALNLRTDASIRFENGLDINLTTRALDRAAELIQGIASGEVVSGVADSQSTRSKLALTTVAHSYIESLLGVSIKSGEVLNIFKRLLLPVKVVKKQKEIFYEAFIPNRRNDLVTSEDLIEEVGRSYGYEKIPAIMPTSVLIAAAKNEELINEDAAKNIMVGAGYSEVYNYSLISENDKDIFCFERLVGPKYPLSHDQKYLRPTLVAGLVKNVGGNMRYFDEVKLFEIGKVFRLEGKKILEKKMISGVLSVKIKKESEGLFSEGKSLFYEGKGVIDLLLEKMGVVDVWYDDATEASETPSGVANKTPNVSYFHPARGAQVKVGDKKLGWFGEISKTTLLKFGISEPVMAFELDFELLSELVEKEAAYKSPSKYPAIVRDLSVLVQPQTKIDHVLNIIENTGGVLIADTELFDIYEKEEQKGLAFRIIYQSNERTLTDEEVNNSQEKIIKAMEGKGWEVRR